MRVIEQYSLGKSTTTPSSSEDAVVVTAYYAAVIDGATAKSAYRFPDGATPGRRAAQLLSEAIRQLPPTLDAREAITRLNAALHHEGLAPADRPMASVIIYSRHRHELWGVGDCQYGWLDEASGYRFFSHPKRIDQLLAQWRREVNLSYLNRGLMSAAEMATEDPGRRTIQPFISRQLRYQNLDSAHPLAYGTLDGAALPDRFLLTLPLDASVREVILASDGYPELFPTLEATEQRLGQLLAQDPLCIGPLLGTKGLRPGCISYDDRSYLRLEV